MGLSTIEGILPLLREKRPLSGFPVGSYEEMPAPSTRNCWASFGSFPEAEPFETRVLERLSPITSHTISIPILIPWAILGIDVCFSYDYPRGWDQIKILNVSIGLLPHSPVHKSVLQTFASCATNNFKLFEGACRVLIQTCRCFHH